MVLHWLFWWWGCCCWSRGLARLDLDCRRLRALGVSSCRFRFCRAEASGERVLAAAAAASESSSSPVVREAETEPGAEAEARGDGDGEGDGDGDDLGTASPVSYTHLTLPTTPYV